MIYTLRLAFRLFLIFLVSFNLQAQTVQEDFEGNTTNYVWSPYPDAFSVNTNLPNPYPQGINTSSKVLEYHDFGAQYGNVFFDVNGTFDLSTSPVFSLKIYIPSSGLTGNQANQISLKLQNGNLAQPWVTQSEIIKPVTLDQWQTITFDFANDAYINFDPNSPPPVQRTDFNRVLLQVNGENNYDHVIAYIDDMAFDGVSNGGGMTILQSNDRFEFWGLPSDQAGADVLFNVLDNNYLRVADSLNSSLSNKISVYVYSSNDALHIGIGQPNAPDWVVGTATGSDRIDIVNPYNSSTHNFDQMCGIGVHEMVHCFVFELAGFTYPPIWLNEGAAVYLAAETQPTFMPGFCSNVDVNNGKILTLDELNVPSTFGNIGGYGFASNIAEYIINRLGGSEVFSDFIQSNGQDYTILGYSSKQEFQDEWNQYVYINYDCNYNGFEAVFEADSRHGMYPFTVNFSDYSFDSSNTITNWSWDFNNDGIEDSNAQHPSWTYQQAGLYSVSLTVTSNSGTKTYTKNNYITVTGGGTDYSVYFTDYNLFISKLNELTASSNTSSELDQFWNQLLATGNFPFAIGTNVAFLYRGNANTVNWPGDVNGWDMTADPGTRLGASNIWILEKQYPSDTRLNYKIVLDSNQWINDPHNPNELSIEWGNSQLTMPDYVVPIETIFDPNVPSGNFSDNLLITSTNLGYTSQYRVYTPAGYNQLSNLPVVYVTDGHNFSNNTFGKMRIVMDNLIDNGTIEPIIAVFLDPRDPYNLNNNRRSDEYRNNIDFVNFVTDELIPVIDSNYNTNPSPDARAILGSSYGGYNSAYFLAKANTDVKNSAILSPVMHPNPPNNTVYNNFMNDLFAADLSDVNIYMSYGVFDTQEPYYFSQLENLFNQKGKVFDSDIVHDAHNFYNWNSVIGDALEYFFPAQPLSVEDHLQPLDFSFYPNPASDRVTVITQERVSVSIFDINGRKLLEQIAENEATLNLEGFETGIYFLHVEGKSSSNSKKLLISK
jgi:enterochelin esterase family protein